MYRYKVSEKRRSDFGIIRLPVLPFCSLLWGNSGFLWYVWYGVFSI